MSEVLNINQYDTRNIFINELLYGPTCSQSWYGPQDPFGMHLINQRSSYQLFIVYALDKHHPSVPSRFTGWCEWCGCLEASENPKMRRLRWASAHPNAPQMYGILTYTCVNSMVNAGKYSSPIRSIYGIFHRLAFDLVDVDKKWQKSSTRGSSEDQRFELPGVGELGESSHLGYVVTLEVKPTIKIIFPWILWLQTLTKTIVLTEKPFKT